MPYAINVDMSQSQAFMNMLAGLGKRPPKEAGPPPLPPVIVPFPPSITPSPPAVVKPAVVKPVPFAVLPPTPPAVVKPVPAPMLPPAPPSITPSPPTVFKPAKPVPALVLPPGIPSPAFSAPPVSKPAVPKLVLPTPVKNDSGPPTVSGQLPPRPRKRTVPLSHQELRAEIELLRVELRMCRGGQPIGSNTARRVGNARNLLSDARSTDTVAKMSAYREKVKTAAPRLRSQATLKFPNVRDISDVSPTYHHFKHPSAPGAILTKLNPSYMLQYLMEDMPQVFGRAVRLTPIHVEVLRTGYNQLTAQISRPADEKSFQKIYIVDGPQEAQQVLNVEHDRRPLLIPLSLSSSFLSRYGSSDGSGHQNIMYVDVVRRSVEIFEPHGIADWSDGVEDFVRDLFSSMGMDYQVVTLGRVCPRGPQAVIGQVRGLDEGFCVAFSGMYAVLRALNPDVSPNRLHEFMSRGSPQDVRLRIDQMAAYVAHHITSDDWD